MNNEKNKKEEAGSISSVVAGDTENSNDILIERDFLPGFLPDSDDKSDVPYTSKQESAAYSKKHNLNRNKGYNEIPPDVPVKSNDKGS
ncbi:MAG: hypothetical protein U0X91_06545 [Spirosomataceae bacterium]